MLRARETTFPERFTFHSSRMRMRKVTKEELEAMDRDSDRCAVELSDARVDVIGYACLVAIMSMGRGYHRVSEARLYEQTRLNDAPSPVVTSAGALVEGLKALGAKRISLICPYVKPLTQLVVDYIESEGVAVHDFVALEIPDNLDVGRHDPERLFDIYQKISLSGIDALVASACVQMPSLSVIERIEQRLGIPTISAAVCTTHQMLTKLGLTPRLPGAGALLAPQIEGVHS